MVEQLTVEYSVPEGLVIAYLAVSALVVIMGIVALVMRLLVFFRYNKANRIPIECNMTGIEAARYVLDQAGLHHVKVRKAGFIREGIFGNYYNVLTKTIYLRSWLGKIDKKRSVTSVALGVQKAALARLCEEGDEKTKLRGIFGPLLFLPVLLGGAAIDFFLFKDSSIVSMIALALDGLILIAGFVVTYLNIPVEKQANALALQMLREYGLATEDEIPVIEKVYEAYILQYIADFILEILRMIQWILEIVMSASSKREN